ncbi:ARM repeat-containing protein [Hortaea werneckii]|nr:ARM repeat-containing protein [Hortaea werneckii]
MAATLKLCGPAILAPGPTPGNSTPLEQITALLMMLLQKQHPCQKLEEDLDEADALEAESSEYDWLAIETAMEVVTALSTALGPQFSELWKIFESPVVKYTSSQERFERSASVGTIGECVEGMQDGCTAYTGRLMRVLQKRLGDEDPEVKSNAAFAIGLLCLNSNDAKEVLGNYNTILQTLEPLLAKQSASPSEHEARLLDNAAGCVSRMIKKAPQNVPLEEVLPRLVDILPLKEDFRENEPVFDMIVALYQSQNSVMQSQTERLMPVFEKVLGPPEEQLSDETKGKVQQLVQYLRR